MTPVDDPSSVVTSAAYVLFYQRRDSFPSPDYRIPLPAAEDDVALMKTEEDGEEENYAPVIVHQNMELSDTE